MSTKQTTGSATSDLAKLKHVFRLLSAVELNDWPKWEGPAQIEQIRTRVETLAVLLNIVPRHQLQNLDAVIEELAKRFATTEPVAKEILREAARTSLKLPLKEFSAMKPGMRNAERAAAALRIVESAAGSDLADTGNVTLAVLGLTTWFNHLSSNRWKKLRSAVPGEADIDVENLYVELHAIPEENIRDSGEASSGMSGRISHRFHAMNHAAVDAANMVARVVERAVIIGEPGSGKSTLLQWIALAVDRGVIPDFDVPIFVKLNAFAAAASENPSLSLTEYFFESLNTKIRDWDSAATVLRSAAGKGHRFLMLLDGWDEVPPPLRYLVAEAINSERPFFTMLITSRASGLPKRLDDGGRVSFFQIAGLTPAAMRELIEKRLLTLGRRDLIIPISGLFESDADLREMGSNPFLLSLAVRVLITPGGERTSPRSLADVYSQIVAWMIDQAKEAARGTPSIGPREIVAMQRLSYGMLFETESPRYLCSSLDLSAGFVDCDEGPVLGSRLINKIDPVADGFAFVHATFQEFLAARHAGTLRRKQRALFLRQAYLSSSRFIVLEFLAGLKGPGAKSCVQFAQRMLDHRDRFQQMLIRAARILASGGRRLASVDFVERAKREMWEQIITDDDNQIVQQLVTILARIDAHYLCERARNQKNLPTFVLESMIQVLPASIARHEQIDRLMEPSWREFGGLEALGGTTPEESERNRNTLESALAHSEERRMAIIFAGASRDRLAVAELKKIMLSAEDDEDVLVQVANSLGRIASREAVDLLVEVVAGQITVPDIVAKMAKSALRHDPGGGMALDATGRDALIRRIAAVAPDHYRLETMLGALRGYPVREGTALLASLITDKAVGSEIRSLAVFAAELSPDFVELKRVVATIDMEENLRVALSILQMALGRSLLIPLDWLERKISETTDPVTLRPLLTACVLVLRTSHGDASDRPLRFLTETAIRALASDSASAVLEADQLTRALSGTLRDFANTTIDIGASRSRRIIAEFADDPDKVGAARVNLATLIISHARLGVASTELRSALTRALHELQVADSASKRAKMTSVAQGIANCLALLKPAYLLEQPPDCEVVRSTLKSTALELGWMVFDEYILNADGVEIARASVGGFEENIHQKPPYMAGENARMRPKSIRKDPKTDGVLHHEKGTTQACESNVMASEQPTQALDHPAPRKPSSMPPVLVGHWDMKQIRARYSDRSPRWINALEEKLRRWGGQHFGSEPHQARKTGNSSRIGTSKWRWPVRKVDEFAQELDNSSHVSKK